MVIFLAGTSGDRHCLVNQIQKSGLVKDFDHVEILGESLIDDVRSKIGSISSDVKRTCVLIEMQKRSLDYNTFLNNEGEDPHSRLYIVENSILDVYVPMFIEGMEISLPPWSSRYYRKNLPNHNPIFWIIEPSGQLFNEYFKKVLFVADYFKAKECDGEFFDVQVLGRHLTFAEKAEKILQHAQDHVKICSC